MKRMTKERKESVSAILTGDWHLREDSPVCRTDDFETTQWRKVRFIAELQKKHQCPVLHSGDLFDHWKASPALLSKTIAHLPDQFYSVVGNHDLPQHSLELLWKSGVNVLIEAGKLNLLSEVHWEQTPKEGSLVFGDRKILVWHTMTWTRKQPWPGCSDPSAKILLKKYPEFDLILTGHNHQTFIEELDGRILVNPGCITRQTADQENHQPSVFLWYAKSNLIEQVFLPYEENVISREHIEQGVKKDARIAAFVERLNTEWQKGVSFEDNLEKFEQVNRIPKSIMEIVRKAIEE